MSSYLPKQIKPLHQRVEAKLERGLITQLERYCEYLESDRDYVIAEALTMAFRKDKGFAEWQRHHPVPETSSEGPSAQAGPGSKGRK